MSDSLERVGEVRVHGGRQLTYNHASEACACSMRFGVFLPPQAEQGPVPVLYWLSGLTCTEENFVTKAGAQRRAAELGVAIVAPDTSPRGAGIPGEDDDWDFGTGAGFYVNASQEPWSAHYHMDDYVAQELPALVEARLPVTNRRAISGHSMGGHGALVLALRNPGRYVSVSAFAPICAPTRCPWGEKAFSRYLGPDREAWRAYDASELLGAAESAPADSRGPGPGGRLPRGAALPGGAGAGRGHRRARARAAASRGLRPQLLLHHDVHRRAPRLPRRRTRGLKLSGAQVARPRDVRLPRGLHRSFR